MSHSRHSTDLTEKSDQKFNKNVPLFSFCVLTFLLLSATAFFSFQFFQEQQLQQEAQSQKQKEAARAATETTQQVVTPTATSSATLHVPILMYHYVEHVTDLRDTFRQKLAITPEALGYQLQTLQQNGYTFMYASELGEVLDGKRALPSKPIVLTFDDGYRDFYTDVLPQLKKYHIKATAYIVPGFIGKPNYMFLPQLQEVQESGVVEIAAHTMHHIDLNLAPPKRAEEEIVGSKTTLEDWLHIPVVSFAYPSGRFIDQTIQIVKDAGFTTAVSTKPGTVVTQQNRFTLLRLRAGSRTGKALLQFLQKMTQ
jgi:peptidoglycan/xylan/chitin deacetylase (PgdA/CDA1 family)